MHRNLILALIPLLVACEGGTPPSTAPESRTHSLSTDELVAEGYREIDWDDLIPEDYQPEKLFAKYDEQIADLPDDDPRADQIMAEVQKLLDNAPVRDDLDGERVKLPGFVVPLEGDAQRTTDFLLVPYYGACVHVPPPPANQTVFVAAPGNKGKGLNMFDVIWVSGTLRAERFDAQIAQTGYRIDADNITPYTEPLPQ
ncbi:MAG: DUF3299 domain-containing protein [Gammaproteobacteria bacterium]|nr:DUF3299 domain-containing protein [Gammaproteobacteria bacterium]MCP5137803.1 DUF3299 domain-containing protein [Gammaproteobacteria bacterium]